MYRILNHNRRQFKAATAILTTSCCAAGAFVYGARENENLSKAKFVFADDEKKKKSPFTWPELESGLKERILQEKQLQVLSNNVKSRLQELQKLKMSENEKELKFFQMKKEILNQAQAIIWGVQDESREEWLLKHGCVKINSKVIEKIKSLKLKVVEMGAGLGHWAKALSDSGIDVIAFDNEQELPVQTDKKLFPVKKADPSVLKKYSDRALLLVYPPGGENSMALDSVKSHQGKVVIYCGEGIGGVNGTKEFFHYLEENFRVEDQVTSFETFGTKSFERMWILRRK
jgi:hypothetical protein